MNYAGRVILFFAIAITMNIGSCPKSRFTDSFFIVTHLQAAEVAKPGRTIANSSCASGEQLLGGGYNVVGGTDGGYSAAVTASYPSSDNTWSVIIDAPASMAWNPGEGPIVIAVSYCLTSPNLPLNIVTATAKTSNGNPFQTLVASCPSGSVVTGGGFQTEPVEPLPGSYNADIMFSAPAFDADKHATGWQVNFAYVFNQIVPVSTAFARCATKNLSPATVAVQTVDLTKLLAAFDAHDLVVECPINTFTTGGGYWLVGDPTIPHWIVYSYAKDEYARWRVGGTWGYQTPAYATHPCDPNVNPDCAKFALAAVCVPMPNIPVVKVKITSPLNGASFPPLPGQLGHQVTAPITFTAVGTDEQGATLPDSAFLWVVNGVLIRTGQSNFAAPLPAPGFSQMTVRVTAIGKTTSASDEVIISTGQIP